MLQYLLRWFQFMTENCSDRSFARWFRTSLVVGLAAFLSFGPVAFATSARDINTSRQTFTNAPRALLVNHDHAEEHSEEKIGNVDAFIINMVDGVATCRKATRG